MYSLELIANITQAKLIGDPSIKVEHLLYDSRKLSKVDRSLFVALRTESGDGHAYLQQVEEAGVAAVLSEEERPLSNTPQLVVKDSLKALQQIATYHRNQCDVQLIGITGSNGKTTVKEWLHSLLDNYKTCMRSPRSYNSQLGVALSLWGIKKEHSIAIIEAGISKTGEMERLEKMIQPALGIFTNIGEAHAEGFASHEQKLAEKIKLFKNSDRVVVRDQTTLLQAFEKEAIPVYSWGSSEEADLRLKGMSKNANSTLLRLEDEAESFELNLPFQDEASIENAMHCIACCRLIGVPLNSLKQQVQSLEPIDMRLQHIEGINNNSLLLDHYNSDLRSLNIALDQLEQQAGHKQKIVFLSDIEQSGLSSEDLSREMEEMLIRHKVDQVYAVGNDMLKHRPGSHGQSAFFENTDELLKSISAYEIQDAAILIKGARKFQFERISELFRRRLHETQLQVNMSRLQQNLNYFKSKVPAPKKMMAMVKAYSYGTGGHQIAKLLEYNKIDYLTVAYIDEGIRLRESGISTPIMVLNADLNMTGLLLEYGLEAVIYSKQMLKNIIEKSGGLGLSIHLEFDTGMHRLGMIQDDLTEIIQLLENAPQVEIASIFSHLASADDPEQDDFSHRQIATFAQISEELESALDKKLLKHLANTAGIERFPEAQFDMVRLGIGLYGIHPIDKKSALKPVGEFSSYIAQIRTVKAGDGIGYGQYDAFEKDRRIAVVAVGYADGFNRAFSRGLGHFSIHGKKAKVVGNVCMDMCMCDVTDIDCEEGDKAIIFGDEPRVEELAHNIGTIPYEVLTSVGERVSRIYFQEQ